MPHSNNSTDAAQINALPLPAGDIAGSTATTATLTIGTSTYGTIGVANDQDWYAITLVAGQSYDFRLMGVGRTPLTDTFLTLRDAAGNEVVSNDDGGGALSLNSQLTYTATTSGRFYLDAGHYDTGTGNFVISAVRDDPAGMVLTADEVAWQLTNNFERYFSSQSSANVPATAYDLSGGRSISYNISALTAAGKTLAVQALRMWSDVTGISFTQTTGAAQITFDDSEAGTNAYNNNATNLDGTITSSSMMITTGWLTEFGTTFDSYSFETTIHELGHALGLGHGGNYNGSATYGVDNFYVNDSQNLSIMSYMQSENDEFSRDGTDYNTYSNAQFRWVLTPMIADILAMGNLYGLSTTTRTGNTTYGYNSNTGNAALDQAVTLNDPANDNYVAFTIFDNGGTDTVDMSGYSGAQRIDLQAGASSDVLGGRLNMGIAYRTVVENAYGGGGNDTITGNTSNNLLRGAGGLDSLYGGAGNDTLDGGAARDFAYGGAGNDVFITSGAAVADEIYGGDGTDTLDLRSFTGGGMLVNLTAETYRLVSGGATVGARAVENVWGTAQNDTVSGTIGNNDLSGMGGRDLLEGGAGNDTLRGGDGFDTISGGTGIDLLLGGGGNDLYYVDNARDLIAETAGSGADTVLSTVTFALAADDDIETLGAVPRTGTTRIDLTGNALAQTIFGNEGVNLLNGLAGNDTISGNGGSDTLEGGLGRDLLNGGAGADAFVFRAAAGVANSDTITGYVSAEDSIRLDDAVFSALSVGALAAVNFAANLTGLAVRGTDRIIYETDTGNVFYDADGVGGVAGQVFVNVGANLAGFGVGEFSII